MAEEWAKVLTSHDDFEIGGVFSRNKKNASRLAVKFGCELVANSITELSVRSAAKAVIIAVSPENLIGIFPELARLPWVRIVEKPAGLSLEEATLIAEMAAGRPEPSFVSLNRRKYQSVITALGHIREFSGTRLIQITDQQDTVFEEKRGRDPSVIENWMFANAIHTVDLFRVFGRGEWTVAQQSKTRLGESSFVVEGKVFFESGDVGLYKSFWNVPEKWSVTCHVGNRIWEMRPLELLSVAESPRRTSQVVHLDDSDILFKPGLWESVKALADFFMSGESGLTTIADGLESVRLVENLYFGGAA